VPTAKILTQEVARLLGRNELVFEAIGGRYLVSRDGQPAIGLSAGERTAITLVHFLESVAKFDGSKGKAIVIIDDPVSSLDSEVFMGISTYIWTEAVSKDHIDQLLLLTHNFELFRQWDIQIEALHHSGKDARTGKKLEELYPAEFYEIQSRYQKIQGMPRRRPSLAPWPPSEAARKKIRSTYHHSFIAVATARKNLLEDDSLERRLDAQLLFPNVIRRMLETFLAFKRPEWVGNFNTAMRNSAQLLKDAGFQGDAEALRSRLTRYSHAYSHGDTPLTDVVVNPGEVSQAIAAVFEFMNQIDSAHFNGLCEVVGLEPVDLLPAVPNDSNEDGAAAAT
jgi:wobble nucleotide-excising tRNase